MMIRNERREGTRLSCRQGVVIVEQGAAGPHLQPQSLSFFNFRSPEIVVLVSVRTSYKASYLQSVGRKNVAPRPEHRFHLV